MTESRQCDVYDETWAYDGLTVSTDGGVTDTNGFTFCAGWQTNDVSNALPVDDATNDVRNSLTAAAPELYRALESLLDEYLTHLADTTYSDAAFAALKKARGET